MKNKLLHWQEKCLEQWFANNGRGIVNVVTGAGKTFLAIGAVEALSKALSPHQLKIKIIVPKTFLMYQWQSALMENLDISYDDIGFFSGTYKTRHSRKFMIYVINTARYCITNHILENFADGDDVFLIADECHHYGTEENSRIFDFTKFIPTDANIYTLGLSATPFSGKYNEILAFALGKEIYRFTFFHALKANIINQFAVFNICLRFDKYEAAEYDDLSEKLGLALFQLKKIRPDLYIKNGSSFFTALEHIIKTSSDAEASELAQSVMFLSIRRKEVVHLAKSRIQCVIDLIRLIPRISKIIIFGERIEMADEIYRRLQEYWPNEVGVYHSKLAKTVGKNTLRQFADFEIRILVSCKTLDEGLNVSDTDVGIVVSSTGSKRQRIQRLGRVLRKKNNGFMAYFYYLYIADTSEEDEMLKELADNRLSGMINVIDLHYDESYRPGKFSNPDYDELVSDVTIHLEEKHYSAEKICEFQRNAVLGLLACDWLITEDACLEKIKTASGKSARNYYISMLLLIRARRRRWSSID